MAPRSALPPLLLTLAERPPERLHYLGVSFGLTQSLFSFWHKLGCVPVYVRQTASEVTGEHTCIMLRALESDDVAATIRGEEGPARWLHPFATGGGGTWDSLAPNVERVGMAMHSF